MEPSGCQNTARINGGGEYYNAADPELSDARHASADLQFKINSTLPSDKIQMALLFRQLIGSYGDSFYITPPFHCDYGFKHHAW